MKAWRTFSVALIAISMLTACMKTNIIEEISIVVALGFDVNKDQTFRVTSSFLESQTEPKLNKERSVSVHTKTSQGAQQLFTQRVGYELAYGQIRVLLLDPKLFEAQKANEIQLLSRDPLYGDMIKIVIADQGAADILEHRYKSIPNIGTYLNNMLDHNTNKSWSPVMTMHEFSKDKSEDLYREKVIPIMERQGEEIEITGSALLQNSQIVGRASAQESFYIKSLRGEDAEFPYEVFFTKQQLIESGMIHHFPRNENVQDVSLAFKIINSKGHIHVTDLDKLEFKATVNVEIDIQGISEYYNFQDSRAIAALKKQLRSTLTTHLQQVLDKIKQVNSDCVGFSERYRSMIPHSKLQQTNWIELFPTSTLQGDVNIKLIRTGTKE